MVGMSSSDSIDAPADIPDQPEHSIPTLDPAIAEAVDGVTNRFGAEGLEAMISYAETSLAEARAALEDLAEAVDEG
jgi:hypothetical protein